MTDAEIIAGCTSLVLRATKPTLPEVAPLIGAYQEREYHRSGESGLHIVLDDGNYQNHHIAWCRDRSDDPVVKAIAAVLLLLSNSQRRRLVS